jgi:hypothetical protein
MGTSKNSSFRHCERSEVTQKPWNINIFLDCFVATLLAKTV